MNTERNMLAELQKTKGKNYRKKEKMMGSEYWLSVDYVSNNNSFLKDLKMHIKCMKSGVQKAGLFREFYALP